MALPFNTVIGDAFSGGPNIVTQDLAALGIIPPQWGIFTQDGNVVVIADNVTAIDFRNDSNVANYPLEKGGFTNYDKVQTPYTVRVTFTSGGNLANRQALLESIAAIQNDLNLYDVVTPEVTYTQVNVVHHEYRRAEGKVGMISVTVWLQEIRETVESAESTTAQPSGAATTSGGQVQTAEPTTNQSFLSKLTSKSMTSYPAGGAAP